MFIFLLSLISFHVEAARIKDISDVYGIRDNAVTGYGLVTGLKRTGDTIRNEATIRTLSKRLQGLGITLTIDQIRSRNVAVVMVTGKIPVSARPGQKIDVEVSSAGDATSIEGGVLQLTPLLAPNGVSYAVAQGSVVVGGFSVSAGCSAGADCSGGASNRKNHTTTGQVPMGGTVERENTNRLDIQRQEQINLLLKRPDFTTAKRMADAINITLGEDLSIAVDQSAVAVQVPAEYQGDVVSLLATLEGIDVEVDIPARVVINERTGTVVMGSDVRITPVAVAHGGLSIQVTNQPVVSQPDPLTAGSTVVGSQMDIQAQEMDGQLTLVGGATIGELVNALNQLGVKPRDLVQILVTIRAAGALHADLEVL
jgi:flagellar P-ring protein FlgI